MFLPSYHIELIFKLQMPACFAEHLFSANSPCVNYMLQRITSITVLSRMWHQADAFISVSILKHYFPFSFDFRIYDRSAINMTEPSSKLNRLNDIQKDSGTHTTSMKHASGAAFRKSITRAVKVTILIYPLSRLRKSGVKCLLPTWNGA